MIRILLPCSNLYPSAMSTNSFEGSIHILPDRILLLFATQWSHHRAVLRLALFLGTRGWNFWLLIDISQGYVFMIHQTCSWGQSAFGLVTGKRTSKIYETASQLCRPSIQGIELAKRSLSLSLSSPSSLLPGCTWGIWHGVLPQDKV